ncbi:MAG: hypothetical protein ACYC7E_16080 [Armatimonadota bacterium]
MFIIVKVFILVGLFRLLNVTEKPLLCSGIYGTLVFLFALMSGVGLLAAFISSAIAYGLSSLYFWALYKLDETIWWWPVMIVGLAIIFF